jgi:hypothetical protein
MEEAAAWAEVAFAALGIAAAIAIYLRQRSVKRFEYQVLSSRALMVDAKIGGNKELRVSYGEREVKDPRLTVLKLLNSGRVEIRTKDFEQPIRIMASPGASVVFAEVVRTNPDQLQPIVTMVDDRTLELKPSLFNAGDWVELQLLVDGDPGPLEVIGRIAGVQRISNIQQRLLRNQHLLTLLKLVLTIIAALITLVFLISFNYQLLELVRKFFR